jgi:chromosome segregation ATPase
MQYLIVSKMDETGVLCMHSKHNDGSDNNNNDVGQQDTKYLDNLKEDLKVLETSWRNNNLKPRRVVHHLVEIIDSLAEIARVEDIESAGVLCTSLREYLASVASGKADLEDRSWTTASDLIDLLADSVTGDNVPFAGFENLKTRWKEEEELSERSDADVPADTKSAHAASADMESPTLEVSQMSEINEVDAKELLQKAQDALLSGQGESAKELALQAAEIIAQAEAEERKQTELRVRADLENIISEESEVERSIASTKEMIADREEDLGKLSERLSLAQSTLEERETACKQIREDIESTENQMNALKEKHKELLDLFQEVLPARDAAERECSKINAEFGDLPAEAESMRETLQDMEQRMERIRQKKGDAEAELETLADRITV